MKLNHLLYPKGLLDNTKRYVTKKEYKVNVNIPKIIFLCGKGIDNDDYLKSNRYMVREYMRKYGNNRVIILLAEELWSRSSIDLLTYENNLAYMSDRILLFLESMGTSAELGAFSMEDKLSEKMIVLIDSKYKNDESFINDGPIRKITDAFGESKVIYANLKTPFENYKYREILNEIPNLKKKCSLNIEVKSINISSYMIEMLDIISLIGPVHVRDIIYLYKYIKGFDSFKFEEPSFKHEYAISALINSGALIKNEHGYIYCNKSIVSNNLLLFDISLTDFNRLRAQFMARKYKYLDYKRFKIEELIVSEAY